MIKRATIMLLVAVMTAATALGSVGKRHLVPVAPDSSDFVRASVMYFSPLNNFESILGHCALHMECPSEGLDYIFGLAEIYNTEGWRHLLGHYRVLMTREETKSIMSLYKSEGRQAVEWPLNLSHHEKQRLWMLLDKEAAKLSGGHFSLINSNCTSAVFHALERCTIGEYLDLGERQGPIAMSQGDYLRWMFRDSPWYLFLVETLGGDRFDKSDPVEHITCTELMIPILQQAMLRSPDGADSATARPLLIGTHEELLPKVAQFYTSTVTPVMVFSALLVLTVLVTLLEWFLHQRTVALWFDRVLFAVYALWAVVVLWLAVVGFTIADARWNWYLIPFNLIPVVIWACRRKRPDYRKVFLLYALVLTLFLLASPLSSQIDLAHQLITSALAIRCYSVYFQFKRSLLKSKKL